MRTLSCIMTLLVALSLPCSGLTAEDNPAPASRLKVGDPAPALTTGEWLKGEPVKAFETGKVYVVEFWATWCGPCRKSIPHLTELQKKYPQAIIIGQNSSERDPAKVKEFVEKMGDEMNYRVAMDDVSTIKGGTMRQNWMVASGESGIPCAFVVNQDGRIAWKGHPMGGLDKVLAACLDGTFDAKKEAEAAAIKEKLSDINQQFNQVVKKGDADKAMALIDEMDKLDPEGTASRGYHRAYVLLKLKGDYTAGQAIISKLENGPAKDNPRMLNQIAYLLLGLPDQNKVDHEMTLRLSKRLVELGDNAKESSAQTLLAKAYAANGQYDKAAEAQAKVVEIIAKQATATAQETLDEYRAKAKSAKP